MKNLISPSVAAIPPSGIRKFFDIVTQMEGVVSLGVGEPDFDTPWNVREAGISSLESGQTYYTSNLGLKELRAELSVYLNRKYRLKYNPDNEILVTIGGSEAIDLALRAVISKGDEVLIPEPSFVCYKPCTLLAGGTPVPIVTTAENEFRLTPEQLKEKITDKTKMLILPYPSNPTGGIMFREDYEKIADILRGTDILVLSDEIYSELNYSNEPHTSFATLSGMRERTITVNGFSKAFAMTGWRLGYAAGPEEIIAAMTKIHQYAIMSAPTTSQYAAIEALKNCDGDVADMKAEYNRRRTLMVEGFRSMGLDCFEPLGAFYVFPSIQKTGLSSEEFCRRLLEEEKVAVVPGNAFGDCGEGFMRCCYAYSTEHIKEALVRIERFISKYI